MPKLGIDAETPNICMCFKLVNGFHSEFRLINFKCMVLNECRFLFTGVFRSNLSKYRMEGVNYSYMDFGAVK